MAVRARFLHKLMALVLIPVALGAAVTSYALKRMADDVRAEAQKEGQITLATADLADMYERIMSPVAGFLLSHGQALDVNQVVRDEEQIHQSIKGMRDLARDDVQLTAQLDRLSGHVKAAFVIIDQAALDYKDGSRILAGSKLRDLAEIAPSLKDNLVALQNLFRSKLDRLYKEEESTRRQYDTIVQLLQILSGTIVFIAIVSAVAVGRYFSPRMQAIKDNVLRLNNEQAVIPISGDDEFADVNSVIVDTAKARAAARQQQEHLDRLKQDFVAMVSHDLRTPLASIQLFVSMLGKGMLGDVSEKIKDKASAADRNASRLIRMINDLLDMEKMGSGQLVVDRSDQEVRGLLDRSLEAVRAYAEKSGVALQVTECGASTVCADGDRVVQVLVNLLGNAIKFSPKESSVLLSAEDSAECVTFKVQDQGRGVPAEMQTAIFERFKQVDAKDAVEKQGSGLGLAICKAIVEQHGGRIGVESEPGKGSTFWFTIDKLKQASAALPSAVTS
jgi:signal transduction histidine kinase